MKNINHLKIMKKTECLPFDNEYEFFILTLKDFYIAKINGINRINTCLQEWDFESKNFIVNDLIKRIIESDIEEFDENEFRQELFK